VESNRPLKTDVSLCAVRRQGRDLHSADGTRKKDINFIFIIPWELPIARLGIRNLEGESQPIAFVLERSRLLAYYLGGFPANRGTSPKIA
jgi:hypothetical protein